MLSLLITILESQEEITDWKIKTIQQTGEEVFFVNSKIDMTRSKDVSHYQVALYKDFVQNGIKYKGSSTLSMHPSMNKSEILEQVKIGTQNAGFVKNQYYPMVDPLMIKSIKKNNSVKQNTISFQEILKEINSIHPSNSVCLNSMELFVYQEKKTIVNSKGLHVSFEKPKIYLETITQEKGIHEEIELYFENKYSSIQPGQLVAQITEMVKQTQDRSVAVATPNLGIYPIILSGSSVADFFTYYSLKASAKSFYEKLSPFKPNDSVQGRNIQGDLIDFWLDPQLEGSYYSDIFDDDGFPLEKIKIIDKGILIRYWGDLRFSHYVNAFPPTGGLRNYSVGLGSKTLTQLKQDPYIEVVSFSDFQMDTITGDFGGEIRLGYYFDGMKVVPITKGSIVGNLLECQNDIQLSQESQSIMNFRGPKSILIKNATISGS